MDALQFAAKVSLSHLHNDISGVTGPDGNAVRVWLKNGWGVKIAMDGGETARVSTISFREPFDPGWTTEPAWSLRYSGKGEQYVSSAPGIWEHMGAAQVVDLLTSHVDLCRVQPLANLS